jgi:3'-5' exoribonuclease
MIGDYRPGQKVTDFLMIRKKEIRSKHESMETYLSLELGDASGRIFGSLWKNVDQAYAALDEGKPAKVRAMVIDWKGHLHLSVERIRPVTASDHVDISSFVPKSSLDYNVIHKEISDRIETVSNTAVRDLLESFFNDEIFLECFRNAPGGKLWHHCYAGGLAEHTLSVTKLAMQMAEFYPQIRKDVLIAGALLHDVGKIQEYETNGYFDFSDEGRLHGHIAIGFHLVAERIKTLANFPKELRDRILHLILSHQGKQEQGSPVVPMTREALVLYHADELDSKMNAFERIYEKEKPGGKKWSQFVKLMDRHLYFGDDDFADANQREEC